MPGISSRSHTLSPDTWLKKYTSPDPSSTHSTARSGKVWGDHEERVDARNKRTPS